MTPMDRQVKKSLNIIKASKTKEECLNLKSDWGGSKLPGLQVNNPKGTGKKSENQENHGIVEMAGGEQGEKRIVSDPGEPNSIAQGNLKRRRMKSPDRRKQNI